MFRNLLRVSNLITVFLIFSNEAFSSIKYQPLSKKEQVVNALLHYTAAQLLEENDLLFAVKAAEMMDKVEKVSLSFDYYGCCDTEIARKLLVKVSNTLLHNINSYSPAKKYLVNDSLTEADIEVSIFFSSKGKIPPAPYISIAKLSKGRVAFFTGKRQFLIDESVAYSKTKTPSKLQDFSFNYSPILFEGEGVNVISNPLDDSKQSKEDSLIELKYRDSRNKDLKRHGVTENDVQAIAVKNVRVAVRKESTK